MGSLSLMRTDQELLAAYAATGDESAFAELVSRHGRMVFRTCLRALGSEHDAEEAAQAVFLVLVQKRRALRSEGELAAWLHRVAKNVAHLALRSRARRSRHEAEAAMVRAAESAVDDVGARHAVPLQDLDRELDALPAAQRQAVLLRYLEGLPQEEAARAAGCPQGTLARRAQIGLERLRERLCQRGQVLSAAALAGLLGAEAAAAAPASLLPSILAVSKLAAVGAAAGVAGAVGAVGAQHAVPVQLAEGVIRMMFWAKVKVAAAVCAAVLAVGGGGGTVAVNLLAAEPSTAKPVEVAAEKPSVKEEWGRESGGLVANLRAMKTEFALGEPMEFELAIKNVSRRDLTMPDGGHISAGHLQFGQWRRMRKPAPDVRVRPPESPLVIRAGETKTQTLSVDNSREYWWIDKMAGNRDQLPDGTYQVKMVYEEVRNRGAADGEWTGQLESNSVGIRIGSPAPEAVNGLKLTISADKLEARAGDEIKLAASLENTSGEAQRVFLYWSDVSWELVAPDGESLQYVPYRGPMPGIAPPNDLSAFPEIAAGAKRACGANVLSGNPPVIGVGGEPRFTRVCLLKPGVYKLTAVYTNKTDTLWTKDFKGQQPVPGKVWKGAVHSNTLEIKVGGEFKAPAEAAPWPPAGIPGVTPSQKGERAAGAAGRDVRIETDLLKQPPPPYDENKKREIFGQTDPKLDAGK